MYSAVYIPLVFFQAQASKINDRQAFVSFLITPGWERVLGRFLEKKTTKQQNPNPAKE